MRLVHLRRMLAGCMFLYGAAHAQTIPGMEHCVFPPRLVCPSPKKDLPGGSIPSLCQKLVADQVTTSDACWDFAWAHSCAQLLNIQVRNGTFKGNCYGSLLDNCCPTAVRVDISLVPQVGSDGKTPVAIRVFNAAQVQRLEVREHRIEFVLQPGETLGTMWIDDDNMYNVPYGELQWAVHGIRAADESAEERRDDVAVADVRPYPQVAYEAGALTFPTERRTDVRADRIRNEAGTVSFWIEPNWERDDPSDADFVRLGTTGLQVVKRGKVIRFEYDDGNGKQHRGDADIASWQAGERHHVVAIWSASSLELYLDGQQVFVSESGGRAPIRTESGLSFGTDPSGREMVAPGRMSSLKVENQSLSFNEVIELFKQGT